MTKICLATCAGLLATVWASAADAQFNPQPAQQPWQAYYGAQRVANAGEMVPRPAPAATLRPTAAAQRPTAASANAYGYEASGYGTGSYGGYDAGSYGGSATDAGCCGADSGGACCPAPACCPPPVCWAVSVGALMLARDHGNNYYYSYDESSEDLQYLNPKQDADFGGAPGFEVALTRFDPCRQTAVELVYWQLFPSDETATLLGSNLAGDMSAILDYSQLDYNGGAANLSTDVAFAHRLRREMNIYNVEFNHATMMSGCCNRGVTLSSLAGFRLFRFDEDLSFGSDPNDAVFDYENDELYYDINTQNTLVGYQLGGYVCRPLGRCLSFSAGAKAGLYVNFAESNSNIGGAAGTAVINNGPNAGRDWRVNSSKEDLAMMAEFSMGVIYQKHCWRIGADYRVIGVSGVAMPTDQIYPDLRGINDVELLATNGELILHGAFLRLERCF